MKKNDKPNTKTPEEPSQFSPSTFSKACQQALQQQDTPSKKLVTTEALVKREMDALTEHMKECRAAAAAREEELSTAFAARLEATMEKLKAMILSCTDPSSSVAQILPPSSGLQTPSPPPSTCCSMTSTPRHTPPAAPLLPPQTQPATHLTPPLSPQGPQKPTPETLPTLPRQSRLLAKAPAIAEEASDSAPSSSPQCSSSLPNQSITAADTDHSAASIFGTHTLNFADFSDNSDGYDSYDLDRYYSFPQGAKGIKLTVDPDLLDPTHWAEAMEDWDLIDRLTTQKTCNRLAELPHWEVD
mmetsp:Transcript_71722/g.108345  ORF Transcript_71722/g.108345 Transcript_71722/m.108345 type:complete len:300 (-) Transcript_71722:76-975(-)